MSDFLEMILSVFGEIFIDGLNKFVWWMTPKKLFGKFTGIKTERVVKILFCILFILALLGVVLLLFGDPCRALPA